MNSKEWHGPIGIKVTEDEIGEASASEPQPPEFNLRLNLVLSHTEDTTVLGK